MSAIVRDAFVAACGERPAEDVYVVTASGQRWHPNIWWYRWLVLWRNIAHANIPRAGGACEHRRCNERPRAGGCRAFKLTAEQTAMYKRLKKSDMPIEVAP